MAKRVRNYRFEMPYQVDAPSLTDLQAGIDRVRMRAPRDRNARTLTLLDTTDERLSWAGVLLAHQVIGETGDWLLRAPDWQPWLPAERLESLDDAEALPEDLARLLLPFRRRAPIRPIADIRVDRTVYQLLDPDGVELGQLLDDRIAVRRGGLVIARHREVTFEAGAASTAPQRTLVVDRLQLAGGVRVTGFPELIDRLISLTHPVVVPAKPASGADPEDFLGWLFTGRMLGLLRADLQVRKGDVADTALLAAELADVAELVRGLAVLVDPIWANELSWHVGRVVAQSPCRHPEDLGESYFDALDALATAARSPRLRPDLPDSGPADGRAPATARQLLRNEAALRLAEVITSMDALTADATEVEWTHALAAAEQVLRVVNAGEPVLGKFAARRRRLVGLLGAIAQTANPVPEPHPDVVATLSPALAYQAGRDYQRGQDETREPRRKLLDEWPRTKGKLLDEWPEAVAYLPDPKALTAGRVKDDDDD